METKTGQETALQIKRTFNAPREKVYKAWTDAGALSEWFRPSDEHQTIIEKLEVKEGGKYRIIMKRPDAPANKVVGEFLQVKPEEKLVYTWLWENSETPGTSRVTVEFYDHGDSTELILTHEMLPNEEERQKHSHGWNACLDSLGRFIS
jgi:uncharacterized protein YndB with AHSA1/START domain